MEIHCNKSEVIKFVSKHQWRSCRDTHPLVSHQAPDSDDATTNHWWSPINRSWSALRKSNKSGVHYATSWSTISVIMIQSILKLYRFQLVGSMTPFPPHFNHHPELHTNFTPKASGFWGHISDHARFLASTILHRARVYLEKHIISYHIISYLNHIDLRLHAYWLKILD